MARKTRRNVVRSLGAGLAIGSVSGLASARADAGKKQTGFDYELVDGELILSEQGDAGVSIQASSRVTDAPSDAVTVPRGQLKKAVRQMNDLEAEGSLAFDEVDGEVMVTPTKQFQVEDGSSNDGVTIADHGDTEYTANFRWWGVDHFFALDDVTTRRAIEIATYGSGASAAAAFICTATGAGTIAAAAFGLLSALLGASAGLMGGANRGHGIVIKVHQLYSGTGWCEFDGQFEDDNGWPL